MAKPVVEVQSSNKVQTAITGERRQVTALFYDIVGSTQLLQRLDLEDFALLQRRLHNLAADAIHRHGGYLEALHGDGGSAYFGVPASSEDAAECAVCAALELIGQCKLSGNDSASETFLQVRIGIATGMVVISDLKDGSPASMKEVIGITPALAARIQLEAEPNGIAVSEATYRLTRSAFDYQPLGERQLKGLTEPVRLWRPIAQRRPADRFSSTHPSLTPLVDRLKELELCRREWGLASKGQGRMIILAGEAGIGKSRLVAELSHEIAHTGGEVQIFQCLPRGNTRPLHPVIDFLWRNIRGDVLGPSALKAQEVRDFMDAAQLSISDEAIDIIAFLSGGGSDVSADMNMSDIPSDEMRRQVLDSAFEILRAWARGKPQLIIFEDMHWADTLTQALIAEVPNRLTGKPLLSVLTTRQILSQPLIIGSNVLTITLPPLSSHDTPQLLRLVWNDTPPAGLASFVHDKSEGVPLFVEELANLLKERCGARQSHAEDWNRILHESGIVTIQDLLSARLSSLGEARRVAQIASVIGRSFQVELLSQLLDSTDSTLALDEALRCLGQAGVVQSEEGSGSRSYRFRHILLQEAAYDSLLRTDRRMLHSQIADLVSSGKVSPPPDEIVAWHCEQAARWFDAGFYATRAAEGCALRSALREAEQLLSKAETLLSHCEESPEVDELILQILATKGPVLIAISGKGSSEARAVYEQGITICRRREIQDRERWFPLYWGWWYTSPDRRTKRIRSEVLIQDLDQARDPEVRLQTLHCAWAANFHAGRHGLCMECISKGLALYDPERGRFSMVKYGGHDSKVCGLGERAQLLWLLGDSHGANDSIRLALEWAEAIEHPGSLCHAMDNAILLSSYERDAPKVAELARRMRALADLHDLPEVRAKSRIFAGWAQALQDPLSNRLAEFEEGLRTQQAIGTDEDMPVYCSMWADLLMLSRQKDKALAVVSRAIDEAEEIGNLVWVPELYRQRARIRQEVQPDQQASLLDFERAISLAEQQGAVALASKARADLDQFRHLDHP